MAKQKNIFANFKGKKIILLAVLVVVLAFFLGARGYFAGDNSYLALATSALSRNYPYPPEKILHFNSDYNSGWVYIAQTRPVEGKTYWFAMVRSLSTEPQDTTAHLMYGITDRNSSEYEHDIIPGVLTENASKIDISFRDTSGNEVLRFQELPRTIIDRLLGRFQLRLSGFDVNKRFVFYEPILYESGDGVIPISETSDSLYVSLAPLRGRIAAHERSGEARDDHWVDFQKFDLNSIGSAGVSALRVNPTSPLTQPNHRWGSIILSRRATARISTRTAIVYWDIFDSDGNRQPGGFTNIDLLTSRGTQRSAEDFQIEELEYWDSGNKKYLKRWRLTQNKLGIDLILETDSQNQEFTKVPGLYFYEGSVKVLDPETGEVLGYGMWEQTHDENDDK